MAQEADRLAVDLPVLMLIVQHQVRIDRREFFAGMALKANLSPIVLIGAAPQEFSRSLLFGSAMNLVAGQTRDLAPE